jgi:THO complex subunit 3
LELKGHTGAVEHVAWNPKNSENLATASVDKSIKLWDARSNNIFC